MTPLHETLRTILAGKATELFADYGIACSTQVGTPVILEQLCGILGFTGDQLCGSVVVSATPEAVACSNPIGDGPTRSWIAELTNQLVGRFKNALLRRSVEVAMSIPVVLTATQLTPLPQTQADPIVLAVGDGFVSIWFEIQAVAELVLAEPGDESMVGASGETIMF